MLISEAYREQNKELHRAGNYGVSGAKWALSVDDLAGKMSTRDILDYGCGQRHLEKSLGYPIRNYDPCVTGLDSPPDPADLVVCSDVLEHIEPECLDAVLDDLQRVTRQIGFFVIANRPAKKFLPDGRNAHLIQEGPEWWFPRLFQRFGLIQFNELGGEFVAIVRKK